MWVDRLILSFGKLLFASQQSQQLPSHVASGLSDHRLPGASVSQLKMMARTVLVGGIVEAAVICCLSRWCQLLQHSMGCTF